MIINSSSIGMESARSYHATSITVKSFAIYGGQERLTEENAALGAAVDRETDGESTGEELETTAEDSKRNAVDTVKEWQSRFQAARASRSIRSSESRVQMDIRQVTLRYIFELLFQKKSRSYDHLERWENESIYENGLATEQIQIQRISTNMRVMSYSQTTFELEEESTNFQTVGTVVTADGREIKFNVNVGMSREFRQTFTEDLEMVSFNMCDPLVINLDTDVARLSDQTFFFDIDGDGEKDEVSELNQGSGYLALDKNGDGEINDGTELFGTASGNGFGDLAKYDEDGNGWIDETDSVWKKLQIWCKDENGEDVLYRLDEKGVGAICLKNASTDFTLKNASGLTKGAIRYSGVFLYENGDVGTIQHVDVAKYDSKA